MVQFGHSREIESAGAYYDKYKYNLFWPHQSSLNYQVPKTIFETFLDIKNDKIAVARSICILAIRIRNKTPHNF